MAQRKRAGLITQRTPDRNGSPVLTLWVHRVFFPFVCFIETDCLDTTLKVYCPDGDIKSILRVKLDVKRSDLITGVAQRKRARLITLRTPDRNGSPVFSLRGS